METEANMETEMDMETETETDNTRKWTWPRKRTWTWNCRTFTKYFFRRNFQWCYILVAPLHNGNNDMKIFKNSYRFWNSFPNDVLAELEISV
jgi:hypothetical protein